MTDHQSFVEVQPTLPLDEQVWQAWVEKNRTRDQQTARAWRLRGGLAIIALTVAAWIYLGSLYIVR